MSSTDNPPFFSSLSFFSFKNLFLFRHWIFVGSFLRPVRCVHSETRHLILRSIERLFSLPVCIAPGERGEKINEKKLNRGRRFPSCPPLFIHISVTNVVFSSTAPPSGESSYEFFHLFRPIYLSTSAGRSRSRWVRRLTDLFAAWMT